MAGDPEVRIDALRSGDASAFAALVRAHHPELLRFATVRAGGRAQAEEAVQETWLVFLERLDTFEERSTLRTFLFGILIHVLRARGRREARSVPLSSLAHEETAIDPEPFVPPGSTWAGHWTQAPARWPSGEDALFARELREALAEAIAALPENLREVIVLRDGLGWAAAEIAEVLSISETNVRVVLHRARARVRAMLEKRLARS